METDLFKRFCLRTKPKGSTENDIFDFMVDFQDWLKNRIKDFVFKSQYIIAFQGKIFSVNYGFGINEHEKWATGGSGMQCIGVAFSMGADVKEGIEMAIRHDLYCGGEITIIEVSV